MKGDVLIKAEGVSKKFSSRLKTSMKYGVIDIARDFVGFPTRSDVLRKNEFWSVDDVSFEVKRGECLGLIGPNGAGKSTLLKMLNGIIMPDKGSIEINGRVGALIEVGAGFHPLLTGRENIYINGSIMGLSKKEIDKKFDSIVEFSELGDFIDTPVSYYSSGMYVRLGFAIAAHLEPDILLIDEVLAVGDVGFRAKCFNAIDKISDKAAVVFVSHQMPQIARICSDILVMKHGRPSFNNKDVPKGIQHYYELFSAVKTSVSGSGRATIHKIALGLDNKTTSNEGLLKIQYLDDLYIDVTFSLASDIKKATMNIAFMDKDIRGAAQCYSCNCNFEIINSNKHITTRVKIPKLQLNPGIYYISIIITDKKRGETLTNHHMAQQLQVTGSFVGFSPVQFQGEWQYIN